jgi:peptidoglycan/LPS O-acetylase OafA/YrhL
MGASVRSEEPSVRIQLERRLPLIFLGMLTMSIISHFVFEGRWAEIIINHFGGLAVVGLLACVASFIAKKRDRDYRKAFVLSSVLPVVLGVGAVVLVYSRTGVVYCGGGVVLAAALITVAAYSCLRMKQRSARV